jgi:hypothetical protein
MIERPDRAPGWAPRVKRRPLRTLAALVVAIGLLGVAGFIGIPAVSGAARGSAGTPGASGLRADSGTTTLSASLTGTLQPTAVLSLPTTIVAETLTAEHQDPTATSTSSGAGPIPGTAPSGTRHYSATLGRDGINGADSACFQPVVGENGSPLACLPPDVTMSASAQYVVQESNTAGEIWTTAGTEVKFFTLTNFYTAPSGAGCYLSDPQVYFDNGSGHWFSSILSVTGCGGSVASSSIYLAVSVTSNPTGQWYEYVIPNSITGDLSDQPFMGVNNNVVVISTNEFPYPALVGNFYTGAFFWVLNKIQLEQNGCTLPVTECTNPVSYNGYGPYAAMVSIHPAHSYGDAPVEYMASANAFANGSSGTSTLNFVAVTGAPGTISGTTVTQTDLTIRPTTGPPPGIEPGTTSGYGGYTVNTDDSRIQTGVYQNGVSWWGANDGCVVANALHDCLRLLEVTTSSGYTVAQDFDYTTSTSKTVQDDYYPGITLTPSGNLAVTFAYSNPTTYPSMAIAARTTGDKANTLEPATTVAVGKDNEQGGRYGDFCDGSPSYSNPAEVWLACEYILNYPNYVWNTHIEALAFSNARTAALPANAASPTGARTTLPTLWASWPIWVGSVSLIAAGWTTAAVIHRRRKSRVP